MEDDDILSTSFLMNICFLKSLGSSQFISKGSNFFGVKIYCSRAHKCEKFTLLNYDFILKQNISFFIQLSNIWCKTYCLASDPSCLFTSLQNNAIFKQMFLEMNIHSLGGFSSSCQNKMFVLFSTLYKTLYNKPFYCKIISFLTALWLCHCCFLLTIRSKLIERKLPVQSTFSTL